MKKILSLLLVLLLVFSMFSILTMFPVSAAVDEYFIYSRFDPPGISDVVGACGYVEYYGVPEWGDEIQYVYFLSGTTGYKVKVWVTDGDGDGKIEPRQHPNHYLSEFQGPIEPRHFQIVSSKDLSGYTAGSNGHSEEFYVDSNGVYLGAYPNGIHKWDHDWNYIGKIANSPSTRTESLAYNPAENVWYAGGRYRTVYELRDTDNDGSFLDEAWKPIFTYPDYGGSHHDGMEYVGGYLWISDMTSDVIGKWWYNPSTHAWEELKRFTYSEVGYVEGMGFGPNDHFWVGSGWGDNSYVYELGNEITKGYPIADAGPDIDNHPPTIPIKFDACGSHHTDPSKQIVLYEWDFESDGVWDYSGTDLIVKHAYPAYYNPDGTIDWSKTAKDYTATLRVTDNSSPSLRDTDTCIVHITAPPWPPVADPDGPYEGTIGSLIQLDGSKSYDPESRMFPPSHPWYETIAKYEWDLNYDGVTFDVDLTGANPSWTWNSEGKYIIALKVTDSQPSGPGGTIGPLDVDIKVTTVVIKKAVYVQGIDVSHHQGIINWTAVNETGYRFAFIKATTGIGNKLILLSEGDEGEILYHEKNNVHVDDHNWWYVKIKHFDGDYGVSIDYTGWIVEEGLEKISIDSLKFKVGDKIKTTGNYWLRSTPKISKIPYWDDKLFINNMKSTTDNGLLAGAYHFACPDLYLSGENLNENAQAEAGHFLEVAGKYQNDYLRPVLDIENDGIKLATGKSIGTVANEIGGTSEAKKRLSQWVYEWMETVREATGVEPILYVDWWFASTYLNDSVTKYDLWVAHWTYNLNTPPHTAMWNSWLFWQWSNESKYAPLGYVPGIKGNVDLDVFNGDMQKLNTYFITNQPPTCSIELQDNGVEIDNVDVGKFLDIYVGSSTDDTSIKQVRFSSDDVQDGTPNGEWTKWYYWSVSSGDWDAATKIKRWSFATGGNKEVWAEVRDDLGQSDRDYANIFVHPGYAVIVAGSADWRQKSAIDHSANNAYRVLRNLGFNNNHIFYLNTAPQQIDGQNVVDGYSSLDDLRYSLSEIKQRVGDAPTPLILYLVGHGIKEVFDFYTESDALTSTDLRDMLEPFHDNLMLIVIGSCYSGSFITIDQVTDSVSHSNRIIITATHDDEERKSLLGLGGWYHSSDRFWGNLNKGMNVKDAFITNAWPGEIKHLWLDDNGDAIGNPPDNLKNDGELAARTTIGVPGTEHLELTSWYSVWIHSACELRVYDSQNRVTGLVNGEIKEEIPNSIYDEENENVVIFSPSGTYRYEVIGTETGAYRLDIAFIKGDNVTVFASIDIPILANAIHQYMIDWSALSQGEEGVIVKVDSDGDGVFEHIFTSDSELTQSEYVAAINAINTWITDSDFNEIDGFRAVFTPYGNTELYKLTATNPGQFYFNILVNNTWPEPLNMTIDYYIDPNFTLKGARPIHVYADLERTIDITANCRFLDNTITVYNVAPNAIIYVTIHLDYALKKTTWTKEEVETWHSEHGFNATVNSVTSQVVITDPIPAISAYLIFLIVIVPMIILSLGLLLLLKYAPLIAARCKED